MIFKNFLLIIQIFISLQLRSKNIEGIFTIIANEQVKLIGFTVFDTHTIDSVQTNKNGIFNVSFSKSEERSFATCAMIIKALNKMFCKKICVSTNCRFKSRWCILIIKVSKFSVLFSVLFTFHFR